MTVVSIPACAILAGISMKLVADSAMNHTFMEERFSATFRTSHSSHISKAGSKVKQKFSPCYIVTTSSTPGQIKDVFDCEHYRRLLETKVVINGHEQKYCYFSNPYDIAFLF